MPVQKIAETDIFSQWREKINQISSFLNTLDLETTISIIGDMGTLQTPTQDSLVGAVNDMVDELAYITSSALLSTSLQNTDSFAFSFNPEDQTATAEVVPSGVDHDLLQNFESIRHLDHSSVVITAGTGLAGTGDITATRTLDMTASGITPGSFRRCSEYPHLHGQSAEDS